MVLSKLAHKDSNLEMTESESAALPFGYSPSFVRSLISYLSLATNGIILYASEKINPFFEIFLFFLWPSGISLILCKILVLIVNINGIILPSENIL